MMGIASCRLLLLLSIALAPGVMRAQATKVRPGPTDSATARAATDSMAARVTIDSAARNRRSADSIALRRAIDSATKRAVDSAFNEFAQDRFEWRMALWALLVLAIVFLALLVFDITRGHDVLVESHWGGFGGGVGGTRFSRTLVLAVLLLLVGGMLTAVAVTHPGRRKGEEFDRSRDSSQKSTPSAGGRALRSTAPASDGIASASPSLRIG